DLKAHIVDGFDDRMRAKQTAGADEMLDEVRNFNERHQLDRTGNNATDGPARRSSRAAGMSCTVRSDWGSAGERRTPPEGHRASALRPQLPEAFHRACHLDVTRANRACTDVVGCEKS